MDPGRSLAPALGDGGAAAGVGVGAAARPAVVVGRAAVRARHVAGAHRGVADEAVPAQLPPRHRTLVVHALTRCAVARRVGGGCHDEEHDSDNDRERRAAPWRRHRALPTRLPSAGCCTLAAAVECCPAVLCLSVFLLVSRAA